jgi:release factor glutamine methyltransferase
MVNYGSKQLAMGGAGSPRLDAELILARVIGRDRLFLYTNPDHRINTGERDEYLALIAERIRGKPVSYITGTREFMGLDFKVNPSVLIPRPETETLVEAVLERLGGPVKEEITALDLGTGSGAIAVSLARYHGGIRVKAVDISQKALEAAAANAKKHGVEDRVEFLKGDLFSPFEGTGIRFDVIVSNPPYISRDGMAGLQREVRFEPEDALYGGPDGLCFYKKIVFDAPYYSKMGALLAVETACDKAQAVQDIFEKSDAYTDISVLKDLAGRDRVVLGTVSKACRNLRWE